MAQAHGHSTPDTPDTRTTVLQQAVRLFAQTGYSGVSMRDIAKAVGISAAALYHHFPDKDALYEEAIRYAVSNKFADAIKPLSTTDSAETRLKGFIAAMVDNLGSDPDFRRLLQREMLDGDEARLRLLAEDVFARPANALTELLGELAPEFDPLLLLLTISGTVIHHHESAKLRRFFPGNRPEHSSPDFLIDHLTQLLCYGMKGMTKE